MGFAEHCLGELRYLTVPSFDKTGVVRHLFTTRLGGVSSGKVTSLNLGLARRDSRENILRNYEIACGAVGIDYRNLVLSSQTHGDVVRVVTRDDIGKGIVRESDIHGVDALVTKERGVPLCTFYADCVPIFLLDPIARVIGLAHSGWRGTIKEIGPRTVAAMERLGARAERILAGIGPSIGPCHFEVDEDVASEFRGIGDEFVKSAEVKGKFLVDLWRIVEGQLMSCGVRRGNITVARRCTYCENNAFYSHRADLGKTGSLAAIMEMVE